MSRKLFPLIASVKLRLVLLLEYIRVKFCISVFVRNKKVEKKSPREFSTICKLKLISFFRKGI